MPLIARILVILSLLSGPAMAQTESNSRPPSLQSLAGVYKERFPNENVDGSTYTSENIMELVPVDPNSIYFRLHVEFYNGHTCDASGIARRFDKNMTYYGDDGCTLNLISTPDSVGIEDPDGSCKDTHCGERGSLSQNTAFSLRERKPIRYMPKLLASKEYKQAVAEDATVVQAIQSGISPQYANAKDLLAHFASNNDTKGVELALKAGANASTGEPAENDGVLDGAGINPPLYYAIVNSNPAMVDMLIAHGADVNAKAWDDSMLIQATTMALGDKRDSPESLAIIKALVAHQANKTAVSQSYLTRGKTAYQIAQDKNDTIVMQLVKP